ncbi:MAG TPA: retropepsin-like aspartic protease [Stellaceae bacterium]|nr:retropepsin-like aspartic protease [Stellaceae bacterium]
MRKLAGLLSALMLTANASAETCKLDRIAAIPAHVTDDDQLLIDAELDDKPVTFGISTYVTFTALMPSAVKRFGLQSATIHGIRFFYGRELSDVSKIPSLSFGGVALHDETVPVLPDAADRPDGPAGILAGDLLRQYNLEVDPAGHAVYLYKPNDCDHPPVYWAKEWFELPLQVGKTVRPLAFITVDGQELRAVVDTGSTRSVVTEAAAHTILGLHDGSPELQSVGTDLGPDGFSRPKFRHTASTLVLGGVTFRNIDLDVWPLHPTYFKSQSHISAYDRLQPDMFLGMHELKRFRFYIDYGAGKMYFTLEPGSSALNG